MSESRDDAGVHGGAGTACIDPALVAGGSAGGLSRSSEDVPAQPRLADTNAVDPFAVDSGAVVPGSRQFETGLAGELPTPLVLGLEREGYECVKGELWRNYKRNDSRPTR